MKALLFIAIFAFLGIAHAEEDVPLLKVPVEEGFRDMNMNEFQDAGEGDVAHTNIVVTCELPSGKVLEKGDKGFDKCVARANAQKKKPLAPRKHRP